MGVSNSLVVFMVSLLIGALGVYVGARAVTGVDDYAYAIVTALVGAVVWVVVAVLFGWIPFFGPALALLAYLGVIRRRYPGGWITAVTVALIAWIAAVAVLYALAVIGVTDFGALGVPGI